jgi:hypothetical protein
MKRHCRHRSVVRLAFLLSISFLANLTARPRDDDGDFTWLKSANVDCIVISLADQRMDVFGDHQLIAWSNISTGRTGYHTPTGLFYITDKDLDHHSNLYHSAPMPYYLRLTDDGVGLHGGYLPGYPASHGCIRLPPEMARELFQHSEPGVFVEIIDGPISSITGTVPGNARTVANN